MPTSIDEAPATENGASGGLASKLSAVAIVVASIGTIAILFLFLSSRNDQVTAVSSVPAQPDPQAQAVPEADSDQAATTPALPPPVAPIPAVPSLPPPVPTAPAVDSQGFVDSQARCPIGQDAAAIARTARATIVICDDDGDYTYRGVRSADGAFLEVDDVRPMPAGFEARNGETTYRLSPAELVVISGETLQSRDPMVDYQSN
ncbi:hypothetical protein [Mycobacterium sp. SMC-4]|uniref:hypothetical protein n=1 Tax=Mycobacterium sp. SMC-4 TaxID=2857059 RepID=UPI0021B44EA3|nr:hypothetical protein [Mycobacterium sp. SMC-4]UXA16909.1 hypothetical protein KXD98_19405 [Mycobacterium sp. SMC-4]